MNDTEMVSRWASADVSVDTNPESPFWRDAPFIVADHDKYDGVLPAHRTKVLSRWTKENLYFLFVCPYIELYLKPNPTTEVETNELWNWDVAEVFIGADFQNRRRYREFEVSPQGEWVDLDIDRDLPRPEVGWAWQSNMIPAARIDASRQTWYAYMRVPYACIDSRPAAAGNKLRLNFFRCEGHGAGRVYVTWQPPMSETFHEPEKFGLLTLIE